ncbi:MAG: AAA family ATPase [Chloroflexota bacterium]|nr:AAA family ATPase [Chloroflexota bacterium]
MPEERRLVTVLFADVVGSTSLGESLDPEDLRRLLARFFEIARQVVESHAGTLEKFIGDAVMAIFGLPQAHDDDARRAIDAALELVALVREDPVLGDRLPIRLGINSGEVVASRERDQGDFIVTGDAVNVAARLQQAAEPWEVLASGRTASAAGDAYDFGPPVELQLKGKASAVTARMVIGPSSAARPRTPLVGRDADLAQLELVARRAFSERRPYLVSLIAPAGTGKSRLVEEFTSRLASLEPTAQVLIAQCLPYGQRLTYWPMRSLLLGLLGMEEDSAAPDEIRQRVRAWLEEAGSERADETANLLAATIGASDTDVLDRGALFGAWRDALELAAARRPLILLVEDLHWSSDSLLDLVEFILQPRADAPMLMLALTRPELLERRPAWGGGRRNHVSLALQPLDGESIQHLVENFLDGPAPELVPIVVQRSEGNPFYAGEIVRSLVERGVDLRDPAALSLAAAGLPDTVQATVLARLDDLDPTARRIIQLGSVFGRSFNVGGVVAVDDSLANEASSAVERLLDRELLRPAGQGELAFRHILIRDVAYGTLPRAERARHHAAAAHWLEAAAEGREDELAELVALHYREAAVLGEAVGEGDPGTRERAVAWLRRAAEVAAGARGIGEAVAHLRAATTLAPADVQPEIWRRIGELLGAGDQSAQAFATAWQLGLVQSLSPDFLLDCLAYQLMVTCRWFASVARQPSVEAMERLIEQGRSWLPEAGPRARARFLIALSFMPFWLRNAGLRPLTPEDGTDARRNVEEGTRLAEELDDPGLISAGLDAMTSLEQSMDPASARELSYRRERMGGRLPLDERLDALNMIAWASTALGDLHRAKEAATAAMALLQPGQNPGFALGAGSWNAYADAMLGNWPELVASLEDLRNQWIEFERPAASYSLQGLLSGIDWARNRGDDDLLERWRATASEIIEQFDPSHPVARLQVIVDLALDGVAGMVGEHARYPERRHYVEHALAVCADRAHPVPMASVDEIIAEAVASGMRILEAQARRLRGILRSDEAELAESLRIFEETGAARYAARARVQLGTLRRDAALVSAGSEELDRLGELDRLATLGLGRESPR